MSNLHIKCKSGVIYFISQGETGIKREVKTFVFEIHSKATIKFRIGRTYNSLTGLIYNAG